VTKVASPTSATGAAPGLAVGAAVVALSAAGGAIALASGVSGLGSRLEHRLPFGSPVLGGLALALVIAVPFTLVAVWAWQGYPAARERAAQAGALLIAWIVVELAFLRELSFLHPTMALVGAAFVLVGRSARHP